MRSHRLPIVLLILAAAVAVGRWHQWRTRMESGRQFGPAFQRAAAARSIHQVPVTRVPLLSTAVSRPTATAAAPAPFVSVATAVGTPRFPDAQFPLRLRNTAASIDELSARDHALLLRHALVDTTSGEPLAIPAHLRADAEPGAFVVQARGHVDAQFRALLVREGAEEVSYIPNNALLVKATAATAQRLADAVETAAVLAYEPYFKFDTELLPLAVDQAPLKDGTRLLLTVREEGGTLAAVEKLAGPVLARSRSPFGSLWTVQPPADALVALSHLSEVYNLEVAHQRRLANDLAGPKVGSTTNDLNDGQYLGLTGDGVTVNINDTGVDQGHPALSGRVSSPIASALTDDDGHGTHVAGILAGGDGTIANTPPGSPTNSNFRGRAPKAKLYALPVNLLTGPSQSDEFLQTNAATAGTFISNNSWAYDAAFDYSSASASYDAAVRDALPDASGHQPLLYVFAAGNWGFGPDNGQGGIGDVISAPANAKNVITVGALEQARNITNAIITDVDGNVVPPDALSTNYLYTTNVVFLEQTDTDFQVAGYSSRGNVSIGREGLSGRFKPDVVAPGSFLISARSSGFKLEDHVDTNSFEGMVLKDLNGQLGDKYRYESGTSMSAGSVSGVLALMQQFFAEHSLRFSPSLFKALLLNGARPTSGAYAVNPHNAFNYAGWGLVHLTNTLPASWGGGSDLTDAPLRYVEESFTNAVATGESRAWALDLDPALAPDATVRVTLVWTDPPGNPAASVKLVNNLDLIVSNKLTGEFYYGNEFTVNLNESVHRTTNDVSRLDRINNVESVQLKAAGTNFVIYVVGRGINVNSLGRDPGSLPELTLQDFALVVSTGDGDSPNAIKKFERIDVAPFVPPVTVVTNGLPLLAERAGAHSPRFGDQFGTPAQWRYYVFTNILGGTSFDGSLTNGSNVAFVTFQVPNLARPRAQEADIDMYVSFNPALTNTDPAAIRGAFKSIRRGGTEFVIFTNAPANNEVYYIGIKSEDQQGAEYGFIGVSSRQPFGSLNDDGTVSLFSFPVVQPVPDGTPLLPGEGLTMALGAFPGEVRRVIVEQTLTSQAYSDLIGTFTHNQQFAVLNNHGPFGGFDFGTHNVKYDDLGNGEDPEARPVDGPGSLVNFLGEDMTGVWMLSTVDNAPGNTSRVDRLNVKVVPNDLQNGSFVTRRVRPGQCELEVVNVPPDASKMSIVVTNMNPALPLKVYIRRGQLPDPIITTNNDKSVDVIPPGATISIGQRDVPPLQPGRYYIEVCNPNAVTIDYRIGLFLERNLDSKFVRVITSTDPTVLKDLARNRETATLDDPRIVTSVKVGLYADHPLVSDLAIRLVNPQGARALVIENRGRTNVSGFGSLLVSSNYEHVALTFDGDSSRARLFVNGVRVAEAQFPGAFLPTNSALYFAGDSSDVLTKIDGGITLDDTGLWQRPLAESELARIFQEGLFGRGKTLQNVSAGMSALWPFNGNGRESVSSNNAFLVGRWRPVAGQIQEAVEFPRGRAYSFVPGAVGVNFPAGRGRFTLESWLRPYDGLTNVVVANWFDGASIVGPALLAGYPPPLGNGPGSLSGVFVTRSNSSALRVFSSAPGVISSDGRVTNVVFASFTDNTNEAFIPIKFATPPYTGVATQGVTFAGGFESVAPGPVLTNQSVEGWLVLTNTAEVVSDPANANEGAQFLQLSNSVVRRVFDTVAGVNYRLTFTTRRAPTETNRPNVQLYFNGGLDRNIPGLVVWQTNEVAFRADSDQAVVELRTTIPDPKSTNTTAGLALDNVRLEQVGGLMSYLPEEPFAPLAGATGLGQWTLEVTDDRGALSGVLNAWQLTLTYAPTNTPAVFLTNSVPYSACISGSDFSYFVVEVPPEATKAVNTLTRDSGGAVDLWYSASGVPDGFQADDVQLLANVTTTEIREITPDVPPVLPRGQRYYLGVANSDPSVDSCFTLKVDLVVPLVVLTNNIPFAATNADNGFFDYYAFDVSPQAIAVKFSVTNMSDDVNLYVRKAPQLPTTTQFDYSSIRGGTTPEEIEITTGSTPTPLSPGRWLLGVRAASTNLPLAPITYTILAQETKGDLIGLTNNVPYSTTNTLGKTDYYYFDVTNELISLTFSVTNLTGNMDAVVRKGAPLPTPTSFDYSSTLPGTNDESIFIIRDSTPVALGRGRWFLGVYPNGPLPIGYTVLASGVPDDPSIITLNDGEPFPVAGLAPPSTNYFRFIVPPDATAALFEIYGLSGDCDLFIRKSTLPQPGHFDFANLYTATDPEVIVLRTNTLPTMAGEWYLAVTAKEPAATAFTVRASLEHDGLLLSGQPLVMGFTTTPIALIFSWNAVAGENYRFEFTDSLDDPVVWTEVDTFTVLTDHGTFAQFRPDNTVTTRFYRIIQVPKP